MPEHQPPRHGARLNTIAATQQALNDRRYMADKDMADEDMADEDMAYEHMANKSMADKTMADGGRQRPDANPIERVWVPASIL